MATEVLDRCWKLHKHIKPTKTGLNELKVRDSSIVLKALSEGFLTAEFDRETEVYDCTYTVRNTSERPFHFRLYGKVKRVSDESGRSHGISSCQLPATSPFEELGDNDTHPLPPAGLAQRRKKTPHPTRFKWYVEGFAFGGMTPG